MFIVYYKGILSKTFQSLTDAENYVKECIECDWSKKEDDYSYKFF